MVPRVGVAWTQAGETERCPSDDEQLTYPSRAIDCGLRRADQGSATRHSARRAAAGSRLAARATGPALAATAVTTSTVATARIVAGSNCATSKSRPEIARPPGRRGDAKAPGDSRGRGRHDLSHDHPASHRFPLVNTNVNSGNTSKLLPPNCRVAVPGDFVLRTQSGVHVTASPVWVRPDVSLLNDFGGELYKDIVLVAAYPMAALTSGTDFVIYREYQGDNGLARYELRIGRIQPDERQTWR
jgi:hypothetical protein